MQRRTLLGLLPALLWAPAAVCATTKPGFSGNWKQSNERSAPARSGDVTLHIRHDDPQLFVETFIQPASGSPRHAVQHYTTDGKISISTGADGDEFHTSVHWRGQALVFSIEEHEDGRILHSTETWSLTERGVTLLRQRQREEAGKGSQLIVYGKVS